jgi:hypothetical protein
LFALLSPQAQELPLPAALKAARTAYLVNGGVVDRVMGWTIRDLRKWGRFELVADSEASDITITITTTPPTVVYGIPSSRLIMTITATATKVPLYTLSYTGGPEGELKKLKEALEAESK